MIACTLLWFLAAALGCACLNKKMRSIPDSHPSHDDYVYFRVIAWLASLITLSLLFVQTEGTHLTGLVAAMAGLWVAGSLWIFYFNQEVE